MADAAEIAAAVRPAVQRGLEWARSIGIALSVALLTWLVGQADGMRQDITALKSSIPVQLGALDRRVTADEARLQYLEDDLMRRGGSAAAK